MLFKLYEKNNSRDDLQEIVAILNDGGIVICPTDTKYAMICHGLKERAVERICKIKGVDPRKNNLSIICSSLSMVSEYAKVSNETFKLLKRNLPGPFTFILNAGGNLPRIYKNRKEVGIRIPDDAIISEIIAILDNPVMTSSLPMSNNDDIEYYTNPELIDEKFGDQVDLVIDGGNRDLCFSTIVDCTGDEPEITREGIGELILP